MSTEVTVTWISILIFADSVCLFVYMQDGQSKGPYTWKDSLFLLYVSYFPTKLVLAMDFNKKSILC